jgi:DNA polymerase III delta subunit
MAKPQPKPVYALIGEDSFLQLQKLAEIQALAGDAQRVDVDGERAELAEVLDELRSYAMFGGGKIVVVTSADLFITRFREQLENYLAQPSNSATLVLRLPSLPANQRVYKLIAKTGEIAKCEPPKDLATWVMGRAKSAHGVTIVPPAAHMLVDMIGADLGRLDNELAKLALQASNGKIDEQAIATNVAFQREQEMWHMTNELAAGRPAEALRRWRQLVQMDPSSEFRAVTWLAMWLENVRKALALKQQGMNQFSICQTLRLWPREIQQPFMETAQALGTQGVARALDLLAEVDLQSKSGVGEAATNVERFLMSMAV